MTNLPRRLASILTLALGVGSASAATFQETFDGTSLSPLLTSTSTIGFQTSVSGGKAVISNVAGLTNSGQFVSTNFSIVGDFTVDIDMIGASNGASTGLGLNFLGYPGSTAQIFSVPGQNLDEILSFPNILYQEHYGHAGTYTLKLNITRHQNTITIAGDRGDGMSVGVVATNLVLAGPVSANFFLVLDGNPGRDGWQANFAYFDNFSITADSLVPLAAAVPEPSTYVLFSSGLAGLGFLTSRARRRECRGQKSERAA